MTSQWKTYVIAVPAVVPPLLVSFINDSPRVMRDSVEADILLSRPVQSLVCRLKRSRVEVDEVDCEHCMQTFMYNIMPIHIVVHDVSKC